MPTFDIVNKVNMEAFKNAIDGVNREIANRYDFKGSISKIFIVSAVWNARGAKITIDPFNK